MVSKLKVSCSTDNLKHIRAFVQTQLQSIDVQETEADLIVLAIDEICANLMIHSNRNDDNEFLELFVKIENQASGVLFEIFDRGRAFNHSQYIEPTLEDLIESRRKGGMGMMLVRRIMDSVEFAKDSKGNVCRLYKSLSNLSLD